MLEQTAPAPPRCLTTYNPYASKYHNPFTMLRSNPFSISGLGTTRPTIGPATTARCPSLGPGAGRATQAPGRDTTAWTTGMMIH